MTQKEALEVLKMGYNAFVTGPAGSGKTHVLNQYIEYLKDNNVDIGITASTGIAATHMGGVTIHSWSGLGIKDSLHQYDLESLEEKKYLWNRMKNVKVLIIDEISMLHHFRLDLVEKIIRHFKRNGEPFGGIQVIFCGDFFQLPPISDWNGPESLFAYHSDSWKNANLKICYLEEQFRQNDNKSLKILNDIRSNSIGKESLSYLESRKNKDSELISRPVRLYTHNIDVDRINDIELSKIKGEEKNFIMDEKGATPLIKTLRDSCLAPATLRLRKGARVMFVKNNFEAGYVNGTLGKVIGWNDFNEPIVETDSGKIIEVKKESWRIEEDGKVKSEIKQFPLRLAWAITIHKSQGMSLDSVEIDLSKSFEKGMGYVALSRVRSLSGLNILGWNDISLKVNEEVLEYDYKFKEISDADRDWVFDMDSEQRQKRIEEFLFRIAPDSRLKSSKKSNHKKEKIKIESISTFDKTKTMVLEKIKLDKIAKERGLTEETIINHIEKLLEDSEINREDISYLRKEISNKKMDSISEAFLKTAKDNPGMHLAPIKNIVGANISYKDIRLARIFLRLEGLI